MTRPTPAHSYRSASRVALVALVAACAMGCGSIGPKRLPADHFDYATSLRRTAQEELLTNMVLLRYGEAPTFLQVASVIDSYVLEGSATAGVGWNNSPVGTDSQQIGVAGRWSDRPTITYAPVSGKDLAANLLTPIAPASLFALVQAGWPVELVFDIGIRSINGVHNDFGAAEARTFADEQWPVLMEAWSEVQRSGAVGVHASTEADGSELLVVFRVSGAEAPEVQAARRRVREILGLDPELDELRLEYGLLPSSSSEIAVISNSILDILIDFASYFELPEEHLAEGRATPTFRGRQGGRAPIVVKSSKERPEAALVAIENRGYWYFIDDRDLESKRSFAFLQILLSLAETGDKPMGPVVSISN